MGKTVKYDIQYVSPVMPSITIPLSKERFFEALELYKSSVTSEDELPEWKVEMEHETEKSKEYTTETYTFKSCSETVYMHRFIAGDGYCWKTKEQMRKEKRKKV